MPSFNLITRLSFFLTLYLGVTAQAQVIGPSVQEVKYSYTAHFEAPLNANETDDVARAEMHASHIFGLFHTPHFIRQFNIPGREPEGIGAPRAQVKIEIISSETRGEKVFITYKNSGIMLMHVNAAQAMLRTGFINLPLPVNPYKIYLQRCTDKDYKEFGDYWYFYDAFRAGCEQLSQPPMAEIVRVSISPVEVVKMDPTPMLPYLRGDNKNGSLFLIYAIHGYESSASKQDEGRLSYEDFNRVLIAEGFSETKTNPQSSNTLNIYKKDVRLDNGHTIQIEVRHLLTTTSIISNSTAFAQFFKEAVEKGDVILYGGHSGLGENLSLERLQDKVGRFKFNKDKKQIFFFDSCSSYSYYLAAFAAEKTKAKIDVITYGVSSLFYTSTFVWHELLKHLISPNAKDVLWKDILWDMEKVLNGETYLLNVGAI